MWIARDAYGDLWLYEEKPFKENNHWKSSDGDCEPMINNDWFPEVSWEDEEPRELILKPMNEEQL